MPRDGSGIFTRTDGTRSGSVWDKAKIAGVKIISSDHDTHDQDIANEITNSLAKDGQTTMTGDLDMGGGKITNYSGTGEDVYIPVFTTFTPTLASDWTYTVQDGHQIAIGKLRIVTVNITATHVSGFGGLLIQGLPDSAAYDTPGVVQKSINSALATSGLKCVALESSASIRVYDDETETFSVNSVAGTVDLRVSVTYQAA